LLRYVFLALEKAGVRLSIKTMLRIAKMDDALAKLLFLNNFGGSLVIAGTKAATNRHQK